MERRKCIIAVVLLFMAATPALTACGTDGDPVRENSVAPIPNPERPGDESGNNETNKGENEMNRNMTIRVGERSFTATLEDNPTARAFAALMPLTLNMSEMNGNEKYDYLTDDLPTAASNPGTLQAGDLMLYGSSCVVLFYESFRTSYSYTRIGRVDNASGLAAALGNGSVTVTFEMNNNQ